MINNALIGFLLAQEQPEGFNWEALLYELLSVVVAFLGIALYQYRKKHKQKDKEKKANTDKKDELAKVEEENEALKIELEGEEEITLIDEIMGNSWFHNQLCELKIKISGCEIVTLFVPQENIELGIGSRFESLNKDTVIRITHECKDKGDHIVSEKDKHKDVLLGQYRAIIKHIELSEQQETEIEKKGTIVINHEDDIEDPALKAVYIFSEKKSALLAGIYRPESGHRERYLVGVLIVGTMVNHYEWTDEDISAVHIKREIIAERLDEIYQLYMARKLSNQ